MKPLDEYVIEEQEYWIAEGNNEEDVSTEVVRKAVWRWLKQYKKPVEACQMRNNVKALLVLQGKQQMLTELIDVLGDKNQK